MSIFTTKRPLSVQSSALDKVMGAGSLVPLTPVGQPADVTFDAYKGLTLKGHVQSIGAGTGSEFSVLPAQNATGNWVKVTQRVPVRIAIDEASPRALIAGLSADVSVDVRDHGDR